MIAKKLITKNFLWILIYYYSLGFVIMRIFGKKFPLYNDIIGLISICILFLKMLIHKIISDIIEGRMDTVNRDPNYFWKSAKKHKSMAGKCKYTHKNLSVCNDIPLDNEEYCYWHLPDKKKYSNDFILSSFKKNKNFKDFFVDHIKRNKDISGYYLFGADLENVSFKSMIMRDVDLTSANLKNCCWEDTILSYSNLSLTNLSESSFKNVNLLDTKLFNAKIRNIKLEDVINLTKENFEGISFKVFSKFRILEAYPVQAKDSYKLLLAYFIKNNMLEDASWAAFKERQMTRKYLMIKALRFIPSDKSHLHSSVLVEIIHSIISKLNLIIKVLWMFIFELVFGYGESLKRLLLSGISIILTYSFLFQKYKMLPLEDYRSNLYFSLSNFLNIGHGDLIPKDYYKIFAMSETVLGMVFLGLLVVVLIRKTVGRN